MRKYSRKMTRRKMRRRRGKGKYRTKRVPTSAGGASLGRKAISGGLDEEDAAVKRHQKYGVVMEYAKTDTLSSNHAGVVVHGSFPQYTVGRAMCYAMVKKIFNRASQFMKNFNDTVKPIQGGGNLRLYFQFEQQVASGEQDYQEIIVGTDTYGDVGDGVWNKFVKKLSAVEKQLWIKFTRFWLTDDVDASKWFASLDADALTFKIDTVSNFVYQNRTKTDDASPSSNAYDVSQDPLFEVEAVGKGTGPVYVTGGAELPVLNGAISTTNGYTFPDFSNVKLANFLYTEPSKGWFTNCKYLVDTAANPGVVKQSKLKSHYKFNLNKLVPYLNIFGGATPLDYTYCKLGKWKQLWFRKTIDLTGGTSQPITVAFQHHFAIGVTAMYKVNNRTVPYTANVN